ncbi:hypothetical protein [Plantactinospora sp. GCM10030261]|uniref:discoidin domain-containing protein n=1 Tax=Plantactinospora sp. GCM10030261 TaxID=3273420 RepID=UPI003621665B
MASAVCGECGQRSPAGVQFCGTCGAFLEWAQEDPGGGEPAPPVDAVAPPDLAAAPPAPSDPVLGESPPDPAAGPVGRPAGGAAVRRPDEAPRHRPVALPETPAPLAAGERPCSGCGTGNDPARRFCRSCGAPLTGTVVERRPPWWRRLLAALGGRRVYRAGYRRPVTEPARWWRPVLLMAVLLALVLLGAGPGWGMVGRLVDTVRDRTADRVAVTPAAARASSAAPRAGAEQVFDGVSNRYWAPADSAEGAWVEVDFDRPVRLLNIIVTSGVSTDQRQFLTQDRPRELEVAATTGSGEVVRTTLTLSDAPGAQPFAVTVGDALRVRFVIRSVYDSRQGHLCGLAELEFRARG